MKQFEKWNEGENIYLYHDCDDQPLQELIVAERANTWKAALEFIQNMFQVNCHCDIPVFNVPEEVEKELQ